MNHEPRNCDGENLARKRRAMSIDSAASDKRKFVVASTLFRDTLAPQKKRLRAYLSTA
ncbi:hypothetical protein DSM3645_11896 [Blastopirellula marina DSM 3645]|uniref:Uncharacterized protein n=1 Tax=Blastopirellula marina DSM 3645 TaxID=314230 RepID=A3ZRE9_9BACT|nr:hypothetical protein DSM3645_11896 [Blastopirellula marina DSM 3645]